MARPIRAELSGDAMASACGLMVHSGLPVIALCRELVAAGYDPTIPLEAYRGSTLCLHVRSIGEAAELEVDGAGRFVRTARHRIARYSDLYCSGASNIGVAPQIDSDRPSGTDLPPPEAEAVP